MAASKRNSISTTSRLPRRIAVALLLAALFGGPAYLFSQRNVYRVSVRPGEAATIEIDIPMQKFGRSKSFTKQRGLPVACIVSTPDAGDVGVRISVIETGHTLHHLRATLRVRVDRHASPGSQRRSIDFTIDGKGGWPTAAVVVTVLTRADS